MRALRPLRIRVTVVATVLVLAVLAVVGAGLVRNQRSVLVENLDESLTAAGARYEDAIGNPVGAVPEVVALFHDDDDVLQLITGSGIVLEATPNVDGQAPLRSAPTGGDDVITTADDLLGDGARYRVLQHPIAGTAGGYLVLAAALDDVDETVSALRNQLIVLVPGVSVLFAAIVWVIAGRTLRPVEEARERQDRFVADASHELRSPLTRLRAELEADLAADDADLTATHQRLLEEAIGMQHLVDDLLLVARSTTTADRLAQDPVDLDDIVLEAALQIRGRGGVAVDSSGVGAAQVLGDRTALHRAIVNVVENAARHAASTVRLTVTDADGTAVVTVADDGPGIPEGQHERIFGRFTRVDGARARDDGGAGLGLAIAREIVQRHRGTLVVDGEHKPGAQFVFRLPLA